MKAKAAPAPTGSHMRNWMEHSNKSIAMLCIELEGAALAEMCTCPGTDITRVELNTVRTFEL